MNKRWLKISFALMFVAIAAFFLWAYPDEYSNPDKFFVNQGHIFGTYYNIRYSAEHDLEEDILRTLNNFDGSLSTFNAQSTISLINQNTSTATDEYFVTMYNKAVEVSSISNGAFDITVAPFVNAWGFGFKNKESVTDGLIDSLKQYVGMDKISLVDGQLIKTDSNIMLDASAIAKGQACDVVAAFLKERGCDNYLVDIGGEVVLQGRNDKNEPWRVGISKPQDDPTGTQNDLQDIISSTSLAMATSGNYRQFYYENGIRRSHTIDPRNGYPVNHSLLSATVIAPDCMSADALATACMVLGTDSAMMMIDALPNTECYLIYSNADTIAITATKGMHELLKKGK